MGSQVFTAEAMATCAARGHSWRTVRTWHAVWHQECSRCGESLPVHTLTKGTSVGVASAVVEQLGWDSRHKCDQPGEYAVFPSPRLQQKQQAKRASPTGRSWGATAEERRRRDEDIARRVAAGEERKAIALSHDIHPSRIAQILHALRQTKPAPIDHTARDAEIRRRRAANEPAEAVAAAFGMSVARVYQIAPRHAQTVPQDVRTTSATV